MENLRDIWYIIIVTFHIVFKSFKRSLLIVLLLLAGIAEHTLIFYYLVPCLCFQLMFFNSFNKERFKTLLYYTLSLIAPVILVLVIVFAIIYGVSLFLPAQEVSRPSPNIILVFKSVGNLLNIIISFVITVTFAVSAIVTNVNGCTVDRAIDFLIQTVTSKVESLVPLGFLMAVTFIMLSLDISVYGSVPFVCTWVMIYVFDVKPKRKERKQLKFVENF